MHGGQRLRASDEERDYVLHLLQQAHAAGRLDVIELNDRQDRALSARFSDEFIELLEDLPEGREVVAVLRPTAAPTTSPRPGPASVLRAIATPGTANQSIAILSGKDLMVPPGVTRYHLMSFLGGDNVDLTRALQPGVVVVLESQAVLGGATISIPPGVNVVDESQSVMGGNTVKRSARGDGSRGTLVLRGISIMGGNTVKLA